MHRVRFYSLIILAVSATSVVAQTPAAPQPDGRRLRLGSDSLEVYIIRMGQPQRTGYLIDRLDTVRVNGETMLRRIYRTTDPCWAAAWTHSSTCSRHSNREACGRAPIAAPSASIGR